MGSLQCGMLEDDWPICSQWSKKDLEAWRVYADAHVNKIVIRRRQIASQTMEAQAIWQEHLWRSTHA